MRTHRNNQQYFKDRRATLDPIIIDILIRARSKPCADCSKLYHYCAMEFDHVRGEKKFPVSTAVGKNYNFDSIAAEIAKCDIRCSNCHRNKTYLEQVIYNTKTPCYTSGDYRRKQLFVWQFKIANPCLDCGICFNPWQMDFDHRDAKTKYMDISLMVGKRKAYAAIYDEILKCDLVCANCHRIRTHLRRS